MDDLMNKVGALIEEHVEGEVEARGLIKARSDTERLKGALRVQAQHSDLVSSTLETVRDILGAPPGAEFATDAARRVVKERDGLKAERDKYCTMLEQLHRAQSEDLDARETLKVAQQELRVQREHYSKRTQERDDACAAKDQAIRDLQAMREKVQALELKLLEVRRAVG